VSVSVETDRYPIVDCDVHPMVDDVNKVLPYMSAEWRRFFEVRGIRTHARARDRYAHPNLTYRTDSISPAKGGPPGCDIEHTMASHIAPFNIQSALLLPQQPYGITSWGDAEAAHAFYAASNDYFFNSWVAFDDRIAMAVTVSPHDPKAAAAEIRRFAGQPGVVAVALLLMDQMMGSYTLDPIYEAAVECDLPVVVHQSGSEGCYYASQTVAGGVPRSYGERHVVLTQVGAANVVDAIVNGTLEKFPELKFVMVEWGFRACSREWTISGSRIPEPLRRSRSCRASTWRRHSRSVPSHWTRRTPPVSSRLCWSLPLSRRRCCSAPTTRTTTPTVPTSSSGASRSKCARPCASRTL
jgi:predicted TIM-barrel fold metal-dependent hydrolase